MRLTVILAISLLGCGGSGMPLPRDLAEAPPPDLLHVEPVDMAKMAPPDLSVVVPPDMAVPYCTFPLPGIYTESIIYSYTLNGAGNPTQAYASSILAVKPDGTYVRPSTIFTGPTVFHCEFTDVDPMTCQALCCPGQVTSPVLYFASGGWTMWLSGTCDFQTSSAQQYVAGITSVSAYRTQ